MASESVAYSAFSLMGYLIPKIAEELQIKSNQILYLDT